MSIMKFIGQSTPTGVRIPKAALKVSGFGEKESVEFNALTDTVVALKQYMTAKELACAAYELRALSEHLFDRLTEVCGECEDCGEDCPIEDLDEDKIDLPDYLRQAANIPKNAKLCASVDEEEGIVLISQTGYVDDLRSLPEELVRELAASGMCIGALERHLIQGDIVYGA